MFWKVPAQYLHHDRLDIQPRREDTNWYTGQVRQIQEGYLDIENTSSDTIFLKRNQCFGEVRLIEAMDIPDNGDTDQETSISKVFTSYPDQQQYVAPINPKLKKRIYTDQVALDPDNILSPGTKGNSVSSSAHTATSSGRSRAATTGRWAT